MLKITVNSVIKLIMFLKTKWAMIGNPSVNICIVWYVLVNLNNTPSLLWRLKFENLPHAFIECSAFKITESDDCVIVNLHSDLCFDLGFFSFICMLNCEWSCLTCIYLTIHSHLHSAYRRLHSHLFHQKC